jgi:sugar phosphate isomerase/epimerase
VFDTQLVGSDDIAASRLTGSRAPGSSTTTYRIHQYIHIKDCVFVEETGGTFPKLEHTFPGEGHGEIKRIVADLLTSGYGQTFGTGGFSIEPHLDVVYHDASLSSPDKIRYVNYVGYGRRFMKLVAEIKSPM